MFLATIPAHEASGRIAEYYGRELVQAGFVMAATTCWTARRDLLPTWEDFFAKVQDGFTLPGRDWRLIMFVAAKHAPSTYISHVYAKRLLPDLGSKHAVLAVFRDYLSAGLSAREVAMLAFAEKVVSNARSITAEDIDRLREVDLSDENICDIALCAGLCSFLSRFFDAMGAGPDEQYIETDQELRAELTVGKALEAVPVGDSQSRT